MRELFATLARVATTYVSCHPNAGLPNALGLHDEQPADTSRLLREFAADGLVNVVGGCCGTTPAHIAEVAAAVRGLTPAPRDARPEPGVASLYHHVPFAQDASVLMVGERTNANGSRAFRDAMLAADFQKCVEYGR